MKKKELWESVKGSPLFIILGLFLVAVVVTKVVFFFIAERSTETTGEFCFTSANDTATFSFCSNPGKIRITIYFPEEDFQGGSFLLKGRSDCWYDNQELVEEHILIRPGTDHYSEIIVEEYDGIFTYNFTLTCSNMKGAESIPITYELHSVRSISVSLFGNVPIQNKRWQTW